MMKKTMMALLGITLLVGLLSGCQGNQETTQETIKELKVGIMPSTVGAPVQYAYDNGYFEEAA